MVKLDQTYSSAVVKYYSSILSQAFVAVDWWVVFSQSISVSVQIMSMCNVLSVRHSKQCYLQCKHWVCEPVWFGLCLLSWRSVVFRKSGAPFSDILTVDPVGFSSSPVPGQLAVPNPLFSLLEICSWSLGQFKCSDAVLVWSGQLKHVPSSQAVGPVEPVESGKFLAQ